MSRKKKDEFELAGKYDDPQAIRDAEEFEESGGLSSEDDSAGDALGGGGGECGLSASPVADRLVGECADDHRFLNDLLSGFVCTDGIWQPDVKDHILFRKARRLCLRMYAESAAPHFVKSHLLSVEMPTAVTKIALTEILHIKFADVFDVNPDTIGHPGGRLTDLKTGIERQAKPTDYVSKMTTVSPGDATHCTRFLKFLNEITKTHPELVAYLLRLMGYGCTGQMTEELLSVWLGGGANGKTILVDLLTKTLGDYVAILSVKLLASGAQDGSDQELRTIGHLCGARMAFASESSKRLKMDNGLAKKMAAPEKLLGRKLYCNAFSFHPTHKLVISAQELVFEAIDYAIQRRLHVVNFPQRFCRPEDIKDYPGAMLIDKNIGRDLAAERPAILALLLNEARAWYTDGLTKPEIVRQTTESFFTDADDFGQWCTECIIRDSAAFTTNNLWYVSYSRFMESVGREVEYKDVIAKKLVGRGFKSEQRNIGRGYVGFRLKDNSDAE